MSSIIVDFSDLENVTADVILAPNSRLEIIPEGLKVADTVPATEPSVTTEELNYSSDGDAFGLINRLGTNFGLSLFSNPHTSGKVVVTRSSDIGSGPHIIVDRQTTDDGHTGNAANSWIAIDIDPNGLGQRLVVNTYSLRNRNSFGDRPIRNWLLQGSNNAESNSVAHLNAATWDIIDENINNSDMAATPSAWGTYDVEASPTEYRWFRILQNGPNGLGDNYLVICEMELYGTLTYGPAYYDGSLTAFKNPSTIKPLGDDSSTPTTPGTPAGYIRFNVDGANAWLPYFQ